MALQIIPDWMANLEDEDVSFIKRFILASGSLKEMASQYGVTYPTVRLRLVAVLPIALLLLIYFLCRGKFRKRKQMEKMQIMDLE